nr:PP2C family serine/threonine-protein phosphatase [Thiomonas sp. FB-6]
MAASAAGTSHQGSGTPCQDDSWVEVCKASNDTPLLSVFVCDGAGSAPLSRKGVDVATVAAVAFWESVRQRAPTVALDESLAQALVLSVREALQQEAQQSRRPLRDYACTFLGVLGSPTCTLAFQIGDGGIVLDCGQGLELALEPMTGEYANMTHFITQDDALDVLECKVYKQVAQRVAVFTDGIQRLALNMAQGTAHEPFFRPFFSGLLRATAQQREGLQGLLHHFLDSPAVNERTDDDKTLALAVWSEGDPGEEDADEARARHSTSQDDGRREGAV